MTQRDRDIDMLWTIGAGSMAGGVIGTALADEIRSGKLVLSVLLITAIVLISGYRGKRRIIRLSVSAIVATITIALELVATSIP